MSANVEIYTPLGLDGYELCHPVRKEDFETINVAIDGTPRQSGWKPIPVKLVHSDEGQDLIESDSPWLGAHALIVRARVVEAMGRYFVSLASYFLSHVQKRMFGSTTQPG